MLVLNGPGCAGRKMRRAFLSKRDGDFYVAPLVATWRHQRRRGAESAGLRRTRPVLARIHIQYFAPRTGISGKLADSFRIPLQWEPKCAARPPSRPQTGRDIHCQSLSGNLCISLYPKDHRFMACFLSFSFDQFSCLTPCGNLIDRIVSLLMSGCLIFRR